MCEVAVRNRSQTVGLEQRFDEFFLIPMIYF